MLITINTSCFSQQNLIKNGSFEMAEEGKNFPAAWEFFGEKEYFRLEKYEKNKSQYLKIDVPRKKARKEGAFIISDFIPIKAGNTYTVSVVTSLFNFQ